MLLWFHVPISGALDAGLQSQHFGKVLPSSAGASGRLFTFIAMFSLSTWRSLGLERRFGISYRAYKQSVNRWLPRFKTGSRE